MNKLEESADSSIVSVFFDDSDENSRILIGRGHGTVGKKEAVIINMRKVQTKIKVGETFDSKPWVYDVNSPEVRLWFTNPISIGVLIKALQEKQKDLEERIKNELQRRSDANRELEA